MEVIYCMYNLYNEEAAIIETDGRRYTFSIDGKTDRRTWLTLEEVTNILYKNGYRF